MNSKSFHRIEMFHQKGYEKNYLYIGQKGSRSLKAIFLDTIASYKRANNFT
jgi:hypothetical protein